MGYTTEFEGEIKISPPLNGPEIVYLNKFSGTRRMARGKGPYYVDGSGFAGQGDDADILDHNSPPLGQPGLWCQWVPNEDGTAIVWNGTEKFYDAEEWMRYLIEHFLDGGSNMEADDYARFKHFTFNHVLNGAIIAQGEDITDRWQLIVADNKVTRKDVLVSGIVECPDCGHLFEMVE